MVKVSCRIDGLPTIHQDVKCIFASCTRSNFAVHRPSASRFPQSVSSGRAEEGGLRDRDCPGDREGGPSSIEPIDLKWPSSNSIHTSNLLATSYSISHPLISTSSRMQNRILLRLRCEHRIGMESLSWSNATAGSRSAFDAEMVLCLVGPNSPHAKA